MKKPIKPQTLPTEFRDVKTKFLALDVAVNSIFFYIVKGLQMWHTGRLIGLCLLLVFLNVFLFVCLFCFVFGLLLLLLLFIYWSKGLTVSWILCSQTIILQGSKLNYIAPEAGHMSIVEREKDSCWNVMFLDFYRDIWR